MQLRFVLSFTLLGWGSLYLSAIAKPLYDGAYLGPGNHNIQIAKLGDRICYQSVGRGITVASVTPDPKHQGIYRLEGNPNFALYQPSANTLVYGELNQLARAKAITVTPQVKNDLLKKCLGSDEPFFKKSSGNWGG